MSNVLWIDNISALQVGNRICPDCGGELYEGPCGGLSINVQCQTCKHEFNDCLPLGVHRIGKWS